MNDDNIYDNGYFHFATTPLQSTYLRTAYFVSSSFLFDVNHIVFAITKYAQFYAVPT